MLSYLVLSKNMLVDWLQLGMWLFAVVLCIALFIFDIRWYLLPTKLIRPLWLVGALYVITVVFESNASIPSTLVGLLIATLLTGGLFYLLHIVSSGRWIGDGDVRFGWVMGLLLAKPELAWLSIFLASLLGLLHAAIIKLLSTKKKLRIIPFGPSLILSLFVVFLYGETLVSWYKSFLGI
jgi:prepilin signal peptidase PulO-like enzyme (type II secretory pathway)